MGFIVDTDPFTGVVRHIGPARVYLKFEEYPGLAMSRSIGDMVAHSVGVSSEPGKIIYFSYFHRRLQMQSSVRRQIYNHSL